jgi:hypothetical protein
MGLLNFFQIIDGQIIANSRQKMMLQHLYCTQFVDFQFFMLFLIILHKKILSKQIENSECCSCLFFACSAIKKYRSAIFFVFQAAI